MAASSIDFQAVLQFLPLPKSLQSGLLRAAAQGGPPFDRQKQFCIDQGQLCRIHALLLQAPYRLISGRNVAALKKPAGDRIRFGEPPVVAPNALKAEFCSPGT